MYESRTKTLGLRVDDDPAARLKAVRGLAKEVAAALAGAGDDQTVASR